MDPAALVATPTTLSMKVLSKDRWEWKTGEGAKNESASTESQMSYETRLSIFYTLLRATTEEQSRELRGKRKGKRIGELAGSN